MNQFTPSDLKNCCFAITTLSNNILNTIDPFCVTNLSKLSSKYLNRSEVAVMAQKKLIWRFRCHIMDFNSWNQINIIERYKVGNIQRDRKRINKSSRMKYIMVSIFSEHGKQWTEKKVCTRSSLAKNKSPWMRPWLSELSTFHLKWNTATANNHSSIYNDPIMSKARHLVCVWPPLKANNHGFWWKWWTCISYAQQP